MAQNGGHLSWDHFEDRPSPSGSHGSAGYSEHAIDDGQDGDDGQGPSLGHMERRR